MPYDKAGKVRIVLQEGAERLPDLPDVPTAREAGLDLKGFRERSWFGLLAPKGRRRKRSTAFPRRSAKAAASPI